MLVLPFTVSTPKLAYYVPFLSLASQHVLVYHKTFQSHGSSGVNSARADANLGAETIPEPIREPRTRVYEGPG